MKISQAMSKKLNKICAERDISVNQLASICYLTQSTIQSLIDGKSKNPKMLTVIRICDGLNMNLSDFFKDDLFLSLDRED